jgi:glycosyltransferase involved in cell wall biosynthesis
LNHAFIIFLIFAAKLPLFTFHETSQKPSHTLKIAVNTRLLIKNKLEGIGWFTYETLKRIVEQHPEDEFYFLFDRKPSPEFIFADNVKPMVLFPQARHPILFYMWFEWAVPAALRKIKADLFLSPDGYVSLSTKTPTLAIMHDLNFEHFPQDLPFLVRRYYRYYFPRFAKKAIRIGTVSDYSRKDISKAYNVPESKIDVMYNGVSKVFTPLSQKNIQETRDRYAQSKPYFLFVGSLHPRKNLARLFEAFDVFRSKGSHDIKLLVVGEKKWWTEPIRIAYEQMVHKKHVIFCGRLNINDLRDVTASAFATTYVSYFEGFGIPIVESFKSGVPVITSNVTSMPEVAGEAALLVDPFDVNDIAAAMEKISGDVGLRAGLIDKGLERCKQFTWEKTASSLWESILKTIDGKTN